MDQRLTAPAVEPCRQRIAVVVTVSGDALRACDREPDYSRRAWLTDGGVLYYREHDPRYTGDNVPAWCRASEPFVPGPNQCGPRMEPSPRVGDRLWRRASANHGTLLVPIGGQGYHIEAEPDAEWHTFDCAWAEEVSA